MARAKRMVTMTRKVRATLLLGVVIVGSAQGIQAQETGEDRTGTIGEGVWEVCLFAARPVQRSAGGYITLVTTQPTQRPWMLLGTPTHYGTYVLELSRFGVERDPRLPIPLAGARFSADSVDIALDPFASHGAVSLKGRFVSDTIRGEWHHQAYVGGAKGIFTMVRISPDRFPVPYPIGPELRAPLIAGCRDDAEAAGATGVQRDDVQPVDERRGYFAEYR
jgi:hypothetical protein